MEPSAAFESIHAYSRFLKIAGLHTRCDKKGFLFWPPNLVCFVEDLPHIPRGPLQSCAVFADYMQESWHYGIWTQGRNIGQVIPLWGSADWESQPPLGTLEKFLQLYLDDAPALYPARPERVS